MTQNEMVLSWLQKAPIGPMEAMKELGVMRLAARIKNLRDDGNEIDMSWHYVMDRHGNERRVARYTLKGTAPKVEKEETPFKKSRGWGCRILDSWFAS